MFPTGTEKEIIKVIAKLKWATTFQIQKEIGFSTSYIDYICKDLVRNDFLVFSNRQYSLSQGDKKESFDRNNIKEIVSELASEVTKEVKKMVNGIKIATKERNGIEGGVSYSPIKIKTDFMLPIEDETIKLESNIEKIGTKLEKEKGDSLDESIRLLKNLSKSKEEKI